MTSEDRWVHPADGADPREIDRENTDAEAMAERERTRHVTHDEDADGQQGLSSDKSGIDVSEREVEGGQPTAD
jgi:hypothetical protein